MLYYTCRLVGEQKGDIFQNDRYGDLAEVVSVWIFLKPAKTDQCKSQRKKARESQRKRERRSQRKGRETDKQSGTQESHSASC